MIYFVDEDVNETEPYAYHLGVMGYDTMIIDNADDAFNILICAEDIEIIILDVMLATKKEKDSLFSPVSTNNFVTTGLELLDQLVNQVDEVAKNAIPEKVIFFSAATRPEIVSKIQKKANQHGVWYLDKLEYDDVDNFAEKIIMKIKE